MNDLDVVVEALELIYTHLKTLKPIGIILATLKARKDCLN